MKRGIGSTPDPSSESLSRGTLLGLGWVYGGTAVGAIVQLVYTAVMGRLLSPQDFGLLAMALLFERFGTYFARMGVSQTIIQKPHLDDDDVRVAVSTSVLLGAAFALITIAAAPLGGEYFETAEVVPVIRVMAIAFLLGSVAPVSVSILRRQLRFRALTVIDTGTQLFSFVAVGIGMAISGFGVWSLVGARLTQALLQAIFTYAVTRHAVAPLFSVDRARALYGYGSRISVVSFLEFLASSMDTLLIGRYAGTIRLGYYNRAFLIVNLPFHQVATGLTRVLFPALSRVQGQADRLRSVYRSAYGTLAALLLPAAAGLAVAAREAVLAVLGPQWVPAAQLLPLLAAAGAVNLLSHIGGVICDATAELNKKIALQSAHVAITAILLLLAGTRDTLIAYAAAVLVAEVVRHMLYIWLMGKLLDFGMSAHLRLLSPILICTGIIATAVAGATLALRPLLPVGGVFALQVAVGATVLGICFKWGPLVGTRRDLVGRLQAAGALSGDRMRVRVLRTLLS